MTYARTESLIDSKIGAIRKALEKETICLTSNTWRALTSKIDPEKDYQIELFRDIQTVRSRLMLDCGVNECFFNHQCDRCAGFSRMLSSYDGEVIRGSAIVRVRTVVTPKGTSIHDTGVTAFIFLGHTYDNSCHDCYIAIYVPRW